MGKPEPENEDCLLLNIWTPAADDQKRPVMVWIHGGAFIMGTGNDPAYDGSALARRGDVVIVTINYRLGMLGFPYIPGKTVNAGSFDQILALKWVKDNIMIFGGDPNNVTIFGESAGGYSVLSLCAMPSAKGLFNRVIAHSAPAIETEVTKKPTKGIMRILKKKDLDGLQEVSPEEIIEAQNKFFEQNPTNILALRPLIEGESFPIHPLEAFQNGDCKDIDFMIGTNLDEMKMFTAMEALASMVSQGESALKGYLGMMGISPDKSEEIINIYKMAREGKYSTEPKDLFDAILTDVVFRIHTTRFLEAQTPHQSNTFNYMFAWPSPAMEGVLGACHALELPFVFGTLESPTFKELVVQITPETKTISDKMMDAWIAFARTGNPNHGKIPEWPSYDAEKRATMVFGEECKVENALFDKERAAWDGLLTI
jgi:para-nitrobenzyl esterase